MSAPAAAFFSVSLAAGSHTVDLTTWAAFCGGTLNAPDAYNVKQSTTCFFSKIYDQSGNGNNLVPSTFATFSGNPNCSAGGNTCAAPLGFESTTNLPIVETTTGQEYTLASDNAATGVTAGTSSISIFYNGTPVTSASQFCCGAIGATHKYNAADTIGTDFMINIANGKPAVFNDTVCATTSTFCAGPEEESVVDNLDYSFSNIGPLAAAVTYNFVGTVMKTYLNGNLVSTFSPPFSALCSGCAGQNAGQSIHYGGGGDLSQPAPSVMREALFSNNVLAPTDYASLYSNVKSYFTALAYATYTPPTSAITEIQKTSSQTSSGSSGTATFGAGTGTSKRGVPIGIVWCADAACGGSTGDIVTGVTVGSNVCAEVPNSFISGGGGVYQSDAWLCPNLTSSATVVIATLSATVNYVTIQALELNCPTSGCTNDSTATGGTEGAQGFWNCDATTHGNTANAGEMLNSFATNGGSHVYGRGTVYNTPTNTNHDELVPTGPAGHPYTASWYADNHGSGFTCNVIAINP